MYKKFNPNPNNANVGDCVIRALCKALHIEWEDAYSMLSVYGFGLRDMPNAAHVWGAVLRKNGFTRKMVDDKGQDLYTLKNFCNDNPAGTFVVALPNHVVAVIDGDYYDSWDSGNEFPLYIWEKNK